MEPDFDTRVETAEGAITIYVTGEIDMTTCERLRDVIEPHLGPEQRIVLDLAGVRFMDSSMLNLLVQARGRLTEDRGSLVLRNPSDLARRILAATHLQDLLEEDAREHEDSN
jgi:anti-sigma B factor antagonist